MPELDPNIILQAGKVQYPDLAQIMGAAYQLKQMQQQMRVQNGLRTIFSQPGATDPKTGLPTPNTLAMVSKLDPTTAIKLTDQVAQVQERQSTIAKNSTEEAKAEQDAARGAIGDAIGDYDAQIKDGVDPKIALDNARKLIKGHIDAQPWSDERKQQNWAAVGNMTPTQLRALSLTAEQRAQQAEQAGRVTPYYDPTAKRTEFVGSQRDPNTGAVPVTDQAGNPVQIEGQLSRGGPAGQPKFYQDGKGDIISFKNGEWKNETTQEALTAPPDDLHTVASGAARSAPAMALQAYTRSPAYQNLPDDQKPEALAQFNAGFHNIQIGGTASAKADQSSLTNITKIADASDAFEHTAMANFDQALKLAPKGIKTNLGPLVERWVQDPAKALGDPGVPAYQAALLTAANEYAKVIAGSTGSQGSTVDSRREAAAMFSSLYSTDQIESVIAVAKRDMDNKIASYAGMREGIKARLAGETGVGAGGAPAKAAAPAHQDPYQSADDVVAAFHAGTLTRDAALKLLRERGWAH